MVPFTPVHGPENWYAREYKDPASYTYVLTRSDIAELDAAVEKIKSSGSKLEETKKDDFPLPILGPKLKQLLREAQFGRGFQLIRGVPVERYSREESVIAYWGMGLYWGPMKSNNKKGHLIGHIKDLGHDPNSPTTRLFATSAAQPFHNDSSDIVTLLCLKNAKEGGHSSWASSVTVYNEILKRRPDLAQLLAGPWFFDRKGEVPPGKQGFFEIPVLNFHKGYLSVNFSDNYFRLSQRHPEVPRLTPAHYEAMDLFTSLASSDELRLDGVLQPGDIQILSNHVCLHARGAFTDHLENDQKRHLLRLWISPTDDRPLPDAYKEILGGSVEIGNRGGIVVDGTELKITLEAE